MLTISKYYCLKLRKIIKNKNIIIQLKENLKEIYFLYQEKKKIIAFLVDFHTYDCDNSNNNN